MITRAQIRRQLRASGGIMNVAPREKFGIGSSFQKFKDKVVDRTRKIIPNELADIAVKAAPFVAPFNPGIAGLMRGIGRLDQRGNLMDAFKQGLATTAFGAGTRYLGGAENIMGGGLRGGFTNPIGEGRMQSMKDLFQGGREAGDKNIMGTEGTKGNQGVIRKMTDKVFEKVPFSDKLDQIVKEKLLVGGITAAGSYLYEKFIEGYPDPEPGEDMEKYLAERKQRVGAQMRTYMDNYFANDPEYMKLDDAGRNEFVSRYNVRDGGRIGYQTGGISMANTLQQNIERNRQQATGIQAMLNEARKRASLPAVQAAPGPGGISGPMALPDLNNMTRPARIPMPIFSDPNLQDIKLQTSPGPGGISGPMALPDLNNMTRPATLPGMQPGTNLPVGVTPRPGGPISGPMPLPDLGITGAMPRPPSPGLPPQNLGPGTPGMSPIMDSRGPTPEMLDSMEDGTFEEKFMGSPERPVPPTSGVDPINEMPLPNPGRPIPPTSGVSPIEQMPMLPGFEGDPDLMPGAPSPGRQPGGGPTPPQTLPDGTPYDPGRPGSGAPGTEDIMSGYDDFISETYGDGPMISTMDVRSYRLPDGTIQEGSSTSMSRINEYLRSIGQPPATDVNTFSGGQLQQVQPGESSLRAGINTGGKFTDLQRPREPMMDPNFQNLSPQEQDAAMEKFRKNTDAYIKRFGSFADGREIDPMQGRSSYRDILNAIQTDYPDIFKTLKGDETLAELDQKMLDFQNRRGAAGGGIMSMPMGKPRVNQGGVTELDYRAKGGFVPVGIKEKADDVPAMLSKNEFVFTADAVRGAGNGSIEKGAQKMYDTMKNLERRVT